VRVVWRAFELRPEPAPTLEPGGEYLTRVWRDSVYPLAARLGVEMRLPPVQPRSRLAHEAAKWAGRAGRFDDYNAAVFRAFFERGEDIGSPEVLARLAAAIGLDAGAVRAALAGGDLTAQVLTDEEEAAQLSISGVPAFVANRRLMLVGLQPAGAFREVFARLSADEPRRSAPEPLAQIPLNIKRRGRDEDEV
jgi:predicted DsbA family dithiol-disulfide isomerase